jgi:hypothetical protein
MSTILKIVPSAGIEICLALVSQNGRMVSKEAYGFPNV